MSAHVKMLEIVDLDAIFLPTSQAPMKQIVRTTSQPLTKPGENYGSIMTAFDVTIRDMDTLQEETLHTVTKTVPQNELVRRIFQTEVTFPKEIAFYRTIIPALQEFQREEGVERVIDIVPKLYGARVGLKADQFDDEAVLLLENLKNDGYVAIERSVGVNFDTARLILRDMAQFHAVSNAFRRKNGDLFQREISPWLKRIKAFDFPFEQMRSDLLEIVAEDPDCEVFLERFGKALDCSRHGYGYVFNLEPKTIREPWACISHSDLWISNMMVKFEDGKAVKCKFVDFQMITSDSPGEDLILFLFTSLQNDVILKNLDDLIEEYYRSFIECLESLNADTKLYTKGGLLDEMKWSLRKDCLYQSFFMIRLIFSPKNVHTSVEDFNLKVIDKPIELPQACKERIWMIVKECGRREWI